MKDTHANNISSATSITVAEALKGRRLLIVDSDTMLRDLLHYHFSAVGIQIDMCYSFADFLSLNFKDYVAAIVDIDIDDAGLQIVEMINTAQAPGEHIPVIVTGNRDNENDLIAGLTAGADDYIMRPFSVSDLKRRFSHIFNLE